MEERVEAIRDVGGEDEHYQVMHSKSVHTRFIHSMSRTHRYGPTGGKLRYPAISSKALPHTTLDAGVKH
jgi:hypothetical protein